MVMLYIASPDHESIQCEGKRIQLPAQSIVGKTRRRDSDPDDGLRRATPESLREVVHPAQLAGQWVVARQAKRSALCNNKHLVPPAAQQAQGEKSRTRRVDYSAARRSTAATQCARPKEER